MAFLKKAMKWLAPGVEPSEEKKQQGFGNGEYPAAGHFDRMFNATYEAIEELQQKAGEVKTVNNQEPDETGNINVTVDTSNLATKTELDTHKADNTKQIPHLGTTTNVGDAYSITTTETINANQKFTIKFNAASATAPTLSINGGAAKAIKKANGNNAKLYASVYTLFWDGSNFIQLGEGGEYGNATASQVLAPNTIGTDNGVIAGTMPNRGTFNLGLGASVPAGYYSGGTTADGKRYITGTLSPASLPNMTSGTVTGLPFIPKVIMFKNTNSDRYASVAMKVGSTWISKLTDPGYNSSSYCVEVPTEPIDGSFPWRVTGGQTLNNVTWIAFDSIGF